jgi:hypothetical protein
MKNFINDIDKFKVNTHQTPWMWLYQFCKEYPSLMKSTYFKKPIDPSYFDDVVNELGCKFEDIAITSERFKDFNLINSKVTIEELENLAKKSGIDYVIGGYNTDDSILWNVKK